MQKGFDANRVGTGTKEWAEVTENIQIGCANGCLYCYAADKAAKMYGGWCKREEWTNERLTKRAEMKSYPARDGVIMFPSTHDITPFNVDAYIRVALLMLAKGNSLLIVSKPRMECAEKMVAAFSDFKSQILFRFTIGTSFVETSVFWEPFAPLPLERVHCLGLAFQRGYRTSVSIEPMLQGAREASKVVEWVRPYITDTVWIGKMNKARLRVPAEHHDKVAEVERLQDDGNILALYAWYKDDPIIRWKDSIKEVVDRHQVKN